MLDPAKALDAAKAYLASQLGTVLSIVATGDASADEKTALEATKPAFTAADFEVTHTDGEASNIFHYVLTETLVKQP